MIRTYLVACALILGACGEDEPPPAPPRPPTQAGSPAAKAPAKGKGGKELKPMRRIEDRVACPTPSDAKKCDPKAPVCPENQYCIPAGNASYCGVCPERDAIRHVFKPRDFQGADLRDPFQSFIIQQPGLNTSPDSSTPRETTQRCTRADQFVFPTRNYQSLKLLGIVSQGTQRKALMADTREGLVVKKGDCVGREKAYVKEIGAGYITFTVEPVGKGDSSEYSVQLWPSTVSLSDPDAIDPGAASAPVVAPPNAVPPPAPAEPATTTPGTTTTIIQSPGTTTTTVPSPQQAPTQLQP